MATGFTVDSSRLTANLTQLRDFVGKELGSLVLAEEMAQMIKTVIRLDSKLVVLNATKKGTNSQAIRKASVARSINRTMQPLKHDAFDIPRMRNFVRWMNERATIDEANQKLEKITRGKMQGMQAVPFARSNHRQMINPRYGTTYKTLRRLIKPADWAALSKYIAETQEHVGYKFAGFNAAAGQLGMKMPKWIGKHGTSGGNLTIERSGETSFTLTSNTSKDARIKQRVKDAMATREKAIASKVKRLMRGEAVNLGFGISNPGQPVQLKAQYLSSPERRQAFDASAET